MDKSHLDPFNLETYIPATDWLIVEQLPEYVLMLEVYNEVQAAFVQHGVHPRWSSLYDQLSRSVAGVLLNFCEGLAKGQGHYRSCLLVSRAEAYESCANLSIGPVDLREKLKPKMLAVIGYLNDRISQCPENPKTKSWRT